MKRNYLAPVISLYKFEGDVITASVPEGTKEFMLEWIS